MVFRILIVCTANICRSPMAERMLRARLGSVPSIVIESAGTAGLDGHAMDAASARTLQEFGGDPSGHVARSVSLADISAADLILTASTMHRSAVLQADPLAFRRAFTLREFARLGNDLGSAPAAQTLSERVGDVARQRGLVELPEPGADEIADPFGAPYPEVQAAARQISDVVDGVITALGLLSTRVA